MFEIKSEFRCSFDNDDCQKIDMVEFRKRPLFLNVQGISCYHWYCFILDGQVISLLLLLNMSILMYMFQYSLKQHLNSLLCFQKKKIN